ncbi:phosphoglycerate kinase [Eggerthellaceae bacterium zg-997]|nr:phosphoglycerate kinase [Eggerthellaceae bacterium zg-997]
MTSIQTLDQFDARGKRVLVRVDFNVPVRDGQVADDTRITAALPTLRRLLDAGASLVLMSHRGRPAGTGFEEQLSLAPVAAHLQGVLGASVSLAADVTGPDARARAAQLQPGQVLLLENLRFDAREKKNDAGFAAELAQLADAYVNDAFGTAHRAHASTAGVAALLPAFAGELLQREVATLTGMLDSPQRPFAAVVGGSKVSDKIQVLDALIERCDAVIVGGGMCFTFLLAQGLEVGASLSEPDWVERAAQLMERARERGVRLLLPTDVVVADRFAADAETRTVAADAIPAGWMGLDIGPDTCARYADELSRAATVFWNGPMGVFEMPAFAAGTWAVAQAIAESDARSIIGGGDSVAAVNAFGLADRMSFISTGGGASMELVEGRTLPGVAALDCTSAR